MLTPKQMFQKIAIALAQVKAGNTFENLLNEIHQIINSLYLTNKITKYIYIYIYIYDTIMNSIKL